jgi:hypothetical protein
MFTDIVGSTALFSSVSPREADRVRGLHFQVMEAALAATDGRLVKNLGDGAMAVFTSCSQAMECSVRLQQSVFAERRAPDTKLELRIGLSTGDVTLEGGDYFGDPVIEAARLCALALPGQILAAAKVRLIAGRYATHESAALGPMELKGLPEPVEVEALTWEPAPLFEFPHPPRLRRQPDFSGRANERAMLEAAFERALDDGPHVALVVGEAGIGKTALVTEFALAARERQAVVLLGRCHENLRAPFQPFEEALSHYVTHAPEGLLTGYVRTHGADVDRIVPALGRRLGELPSTPSGDPDTERHALFRAVAALFATASMAHPVVLFLDDLHWADDDSLQLLRHVATSAESRQLLIVCTYRPGELTSAQPLTGVLGSFSREVDPDRISLEGWRESEIAAMLRPGEPGHPDARPLALARLLHQETGGNPFFVTEMLQHLASIGGVRRETGGGWTVTSDVAAKSLPASVREVLAEKVRPLGPAGNEVLQVAAVIGHDFDLELLAPATGRNSEELLDILDAATSATLVRETTQSDPAAPDHIEGVSFTFHQAIIRRALHDSLSPSRRMLVHRHIGAALEAIAEQSRVTAPADLAYHFAGAGPEYATKALRYSIEAAEEAMAQLAGQEAAKHYAAALALHAKLAQPDRATDIDLHLGLGSAQRQAGLGEYRSTFVKAARMALESGDADRLVQAALANSRGFTSVTGSVDAELVELLSLAFERAPAGAPERALVAAALCSELQYHPDVERRRRLAREADELCAQVGDDRLAVTVANRQFTSIQTSYSLAELLQKTESTLLAAERLGDAVQLFWAHLWRTYALRSAGAERAALRQLDDASAAARTLGQPLLIWWATNVAAVGALVTGDPAEAERLAAEAYTLGAAGGQPDAEALHRALQAGAAWQRGQLGAFGPFIDAALADRPDDQGLIMTRVLAYTDADDLEGCRAALDDLAKHIDGLPFASTLPFALTLYAEAAIRVGDEASAATLAERLAPWSDQVAHTGVTVSGPISHFLGGLCTLLGHYDEADDWYERAAVICEGMSAGFFGARTALDRGSMLLARGGIRDAERARAMLQQAHSTARDAGYSVVERRAAVALAGLGEEP